MIGRRTNALVRHADVQTHVLNTHDKGSSRPRGASQLAEVTDRYAAVADLRPSVCADGSVADSCLSAQLKPMSDVLFLKAGLACGEVTPRTAPVT